MSNIVKAKVKVAGMRPFFFHEFTRNSIPLEREERTGKAGNDPEEWRKTVMMNDKRELYIKPSMIFATIRDGAAYTKVGRGTLKKNVVATLLVEMPERIFIGRSLPEEPLPEDPDLPVYLDVRGVRNPTTRARNVRYRVAMSPGWEVEFIISWDVTIVSENQMHAAVIDAGRMCGLGNGRAIGMGRFEVESFEVV